MEREVVWLQSEALGDDENRRAAAHALGIPFVVLTQQDITVEALECIPEPLSRAHNVVAYALGDGVIEVALLDLQDLEKIDFLRTTHRLQVRLTSRESIKRALLTYQKHLKEKFAHLASRSVQAADSLLQHALHSNASHIHVEPSAASLVVRYRIRGALYEAMRLPKEAGAYVVERLKSLAKLFPVSTSAQEGKFRIEHDHNPYTVHVATLPIASGEKMFLRLAREDHGQKGFTLTSAGFHGEGLENMHHLLSIHSGLLLVAGPPRSGKSTTLYTFLDQLNTPQVSIASVEEKIEHQLPRVSQLQTKTEVGLSMLAGMRAVLRQDPDIVMLSNLEESDVALLVAQTAQRLLVLGGLDAPYASVAIQKLREYEVAPLLLASILRAVVGQRVIKRLCPHCKEPAKLLREEGDLLEEHANFGRVLAALKSEEIVDSSVPWKELTFYGAKGCSRCNSGYKGTVGIQEVLPVTQTIKELILHDAVPEEIEWQAREEGMLTLVEDGLYKAAQGLTSIEEVLGLM